MKLLYSLLVTLLFTSCISVKADINSTAEESTDYELAEAGIRLVLEKQENTSKQAQEALKNNNEYYLK